MRLSGSWLDMRRAFKRYIRTPAARPKSVASFNASLAADALRHGDFSFGFKGNRPDTAMENSPTLQSINSLGIISDAE